MACLFLNIRTISPGTVNITPVPQASAIVKPVLPASVAVDVKNDLKVNAMVLNDTVASAMVGFAELDEITRVELETDYNFTNTATKQYRWQAVYQITHY